MTRLTNEEIDRLRSEAIAKKHRECIADLKGLTGDEWEWVNHGYEPAHRKGVKVDRVDGKWFIQLDDLTTEQLKDILELLS